MRALKIWGMTMVVVIAVLGLYIYQNNREYQIILLNTNDSHGSILPVDSVGGMAERATFIRMVREKNPYVLLVDAGDINTGQAISNRADAKPDILAYNYMGYDAVTVGNHEFDKPLNVLLKQMQWAEFPFVTSNIQRNGTPLGVEYLIKEIGGVKIGIFGLTTKNTENVSIHAGEVTFENEVMAARKVVKLLKKQQVNLIIGLVHLGFTESAPGFITSYRLAQEVDGIDILVDGHSHSFIERPEHIHKTTIVTANQSGRYVGEGIIRMKKYLLFDLDGTLTDPKIGITTCVQYALHSFGIEEPDLDKLEPFIGPPLRDSFMEFYGFTAEQAEEAVAKYRERFQNTGIFENEVYAGIPEMLKNLQSKGYFLALASSKPQIYVERILEHFDLKKYFAVVVGSELDGTRETKDQVVQETLHQLFKENPIEPDQVYMIGDRKFDVEGARALGVESVGVTYGYGSKEELKEAKADYIVQSVEELEKFLLRGSEELVNSNPDNKKKNPMYQRIWTMVYSFLMFIFMLRFLRMCL